ALRKSFPILIHQNDTPPGTPASLCLYFESPTAVLRTWTPQAFLQRIRWWFEASAKEILHPSDQPVEQLFFVSKYELILPSNYQQLIDEGAIAFDVEGSVGRPDGGVTCFIQPVEPEKQKDEYYIALLDIRLPPVVHGTIFRTPSTLGELQLILQENYDADILSPMKERIQVLVGDGVPISAQASYTCLLLQVPITRKVGGDVERMDRRAFFINNGYLKLGEALGAIFRAPDDENYYREINTVGEASQKDDWKATRIDAMDVLQCNNSAAARQQSGLNVPGPRGVLVGVGSLGATLLDLWVRSGWGTWAIIDKDHIKPHNIVRHPAFHFQIGHTKTEVVAQLQYMKTNQKLEVKQIYGDACDLSVKDISNELKQAELSIDATTTLEFPRLISNADEVCRHLSVFVTPHGNAAVLLLEDEKRKIRLRTLEAQYYRALINSDWGQDHYSDDEITFLSGASCRDISSVLSYTKIIAHAGNLAEQIVYHTSRDEPFIGVWHRNTHTGEMRAHVCSVYNEIQRTIGEYRVYYDDGLIKKLRTLRQEHLPNETGGVLLGYYDLALNMLAIVDCLPAPSDSNSSKVMFERGTGGVQQAVEQATHRTAGNVRYIGEWHSHPDGYNSDPSSNDLFLLSELAIGMNADGLPGIIMIISDVDHSILQGTIFS
ncbi:MAG: Mov34/MPN/PAD-1 family protein, partial [Candidatus Thiodiazotropha sp.]